MICIIVVLFICLVTIYIQPNLTKKSPEIHTIATLDKITIRGNILEFKNLNQIFKGYVSVQLNLRSSKSRR